MKKLSASILLILPLLCIGQTGNSTDLVWQECINLFRKGCLDSTVEKISLLKKGPQGIDTSIKFYTRLDTFLYKDGYYAVGQSILDPFFEFYGEQIGEWKFYYPSGKIYSKGHFSIGAITDCQAGGPKTKGYSFKTELWNYWYENGNTLATGIYNPIKDIIRTNCGGDTLFLSKVTSDWKYFNDDGCATENTIALTQKINNGP